MCIRDSAYADKSETLKIFKVHLDTAHCKPLMKIMFQMIPETFQSNNEFILYKGDVYKRQSKYPVKS